MLKSASGATCMHSVFATRKWTCQSFVTSVQLLCGLIFLFLINCALDSTIPVICELSRLKLQSCSIIILCYNSFICYNFLGGHFRLLIIRKISSTITLIVYKHSVSKRTACCLTVFFKNDGIVIHTLTSSSLFFSFHGCFTHWSQANSTFCTFCFLMLSTCISPNRFCRPSWPYLHFIILPASKALPGIICGCCKTLISYATGKECT